MRTESNGPHMMLTRPLRLHFQMQPPASDWITPQARLAAPGAAAQCTSSRLAETTAELSRLGTGSAPQWRAPIVRLGLTVTGPLETSAAECRLTSAKQEVLRFTKTT